MDDINTRIPSSLLEELERSLVNMSFGSIEIYVNDGVVTQITVRNIKKTSVGIRKSIISKTKNGIHPRINTSSKVQIKLRP